MMMKKKELLIRLALTVINMYAVYLVNRWAERKLAELEALTDTITEGEIARLTINDLQVWEALPDDARIEYLNTMSEDSYQSFREDVLEDYCVEREIPFTSMNRLRARYDLGLMATRDDTITSLQAKVDAPPVTFSDLSLIPGDDDQS